VQARQTSLRNGFGLGLDFFGSTLMQLFCAQFLGLGGLVGIIPIVIAYLKNLNVNPLGR